LKALKNIWRRSADNIKNFPSQSDSILFKLFSSRSVARKTASQFVNKCNLQFSSGSEQARSGPTSRPFGSMFRLFVCLLRHSPVCPAPRGFVRTNGIMICLLFIRPSGHPWCLDQRLDQHMHHEHLETNFPGNKKVRTSQSKSNTRELPPQ
jgi:hypothetical protein